MKEKHFLWGLQPCKTKDLLWHTAAPFSTSCAHIPIRNVTELEQTTVCSAGHVIPAFTGDRGQHSSIKLHVQRWIISAWTEGYLYYKNISKCQGQTVQELPLWQKRNLYSLILINLKFCQNKFNWCSKLVQRGFSLFRKTDFYTST